MQDNIWEVTSDEDINTIKLSKLPNGNYNLVIEHDTWVEIVSECSFSFTYNIIKEESDNAY